MMSISLVTVIIFATCCAILGVILLRIGVRGKLISPNPHCRKCQFDLAGHALDEPTPCPECGTTLRTNTPAITDGLQKPRKFALLVSVIFLLTAMTGFAWPKISKLPAIQNINIYNHFPESLLVKLATTGDDDALQILHDRLIPGTISNSSLQKLIAYAFKLQADDSVPWDERWGDVIVYAILTDQIDHSARNEYFESMIVPVVHQHERMRASDNTFMTKLLLYRPERGSCASNWTNGVKWDGVTRPPGPGLLEVHTQYSILVESQGKPIRSGQTTSSTRGGWSSASLVVSTAIAQRNLEPEHKVIDVNYGCQLTVLLDGTPLHEWSIERRSQTVRDEDDVLYAKPVNESEAINSLVSSVFMSGFVIPEKIHLVINEPSMQSMAISPGGIQSTTSSTVGLVGTLSVRDQDTEIQIAQTASIPLNNPEISQHVGLHPMGWTYQIRSGAMRYGLTDFMRDQAFWGKVLQRRTVDVVFRPDPSMLAEFPEIKEYLDHVVIFYDVPIGLKTPKFIEQQQSWGWESRTNVQSEHVYGELHRDDE